MIINSFYGPEMQGDFNLFDLGNLILESGETLRGAKLAYRTLGRLNAEKSNAILVTTWFSGTGKIMQDVYTGPSHALDPARYFIVIVDQLGSGVSSSPHNTSAPQAMAKFPKLSIGEMSARSIGFWPRCSGLGGWPLLSAGRWAGSRFMNGRSQCPRWLNARR